MLPQIARLSCKVPRAGRWSLILGCLALFALPTWFAAAQPPETKTDPADAGAVQKTPPEVKPGTPGSPTEPLFPRTPRPSTPPVTEGSAASGTSGAGQVVEFFPELSQKEQYIVRELDTPTTFDFTDESLDGVRETVMQRHGFDILIDAVKLLEESVTTDATDLTLKVNEVPLRSALRLLLQRKNLTYVIEDDVMKITTITAYKAEKLTRTYPVRDLMPSLPGDDVPDFLSLMEAIRQGVTPGQWSHSNWTPNSVGPAAYASPGANYPAAPSSVATGAPHVSLATISMVPATGSLVIHQSWQGHDEVLKLLRALRKAKNQAR